MSKIIASAAIRGAHETAKQAQEILTRAIEEKGRDCQVEFPNTGYYMPIIYSMTARAVETLADFEEVMKDINDLLPDWVDDDLWLPYLGPLLDAGMATLFAEEIIEGCKYLIGPNPVDDIWLGAADDVILRERGIQFVDGSAPGFAAIVGAAPAVARPRNRSAARSSAAASGAAASRSMTEGHLLRLTEGRLRANFRATSGSMRTP